MFEGLTVAMATPFRRRCRGRGATARLIDFMIEGGVEGLVISGSTGEAATCSVEERRGAVEVRARSSVRGRIPLVAGTGTNNTAESITLTRMAEELGLDGRDDRDALLQQAHAAGDRSPTSPRWRRARGCRSSSTTCPGAPPRTPAPRRFEQACSDLPNVAAIKEASGSRRPGECGAGAHAGSLCSRATTRSRCR